MKNSILFLAVISSFIGSATAFGNQGSSPQDYRELALRIRPEAQFTIPLPGNNVSFKYQFDWGKSFDVLPDTHNWHWDSIAKPNEYFRLFWDKFLVKDGSYIQFGNERLPISCIVVSGQDNRFAGDDSPLLPEFLIKVYVVVNDFSCIGPLNPGWPSNGGKKESWDTYLYYEIRDPTIMLPTEITLRYRWSEFKAILSDSGHQPL